MSLFSADNKLMQFLDTFIDYVLLQLLTFAFCIPVVTIGAAMTAKYYTAMKLARKESPNILQSFLKSFKENFRQGFLLELAAGAAFAILAVDWYLLCSTNFGLISYLLLSVMIVVTIVVSMTAAFVFPLLARFHAGTGRILKSALEIGTGKFWVSLIFVLCNAALAAACVVWVVYGVFVWMIGGAALCWIRSMLLVMILKKFETEEAEAGISSGNVGL